MTDVELDLLTDTDKHLFIEEGIRAGVAKINHRYARANTLGKENYDTSKRNSYIMYLDANNLYGWAMSQPLPTPNFKLLTDEKMKDLNVMMIPHNSPRGYILEYDLDKYYFYYLDIYVYFIKCNVSFLCISEYPHELHHLHKDYPPALERLQVEETYLANINGTCCKKKESTNFYPTSSRIYAAKRTASSTTAV